MANTSTILFQSVYVIIINLNIKTKLILLQTSLARPKVLPNNRNNRTNGKKLISRSQVILK